MSDLNKRTIMKTVSWRIIATLTTMILVFIYTGNLAITFGVGFFDFLSKFIIYYGHERIWNNIKWGTID